MSRQPFNNLQKAGDIMAAATVWLLICLCAAALFMTVWLVAEMVARVML